MNSKDKALALWLAEQQQLSGQPPGPSLHLHNHYYQLPQAIQQPAPVRSPELPTESRYTTARERSERMHPFTLAMSVLAFSLALAIPLAIIATIVQPKPEYHYHQRW